MDPLSTNSAFDVAMARQNLAQNAAGCPIGSLMKKAVKGAFQDALAGAWSRAATTPAAPVAGGTGTTDEAAAADGAATEQANSAGAGTHGLKALEAKLNESIAVGFIAPMLADALGRAEQKYFAHSPAEQTYARQLYMEIATRIGQSSRLPLARDIAQALRQRLGTADKGSA